MKCSLVERNSGETRCSEIFVTIGFYEFVFMQLNLDLDVRATVE